jgi:hypothetical protein
VGSASGGGAAACGAAGAPHDARTPVRLISAARPSQPPGPASSAGVGLSAIFLLRKFATNSSRDHDASARPCHSFAGYGPSAHLTSLGDLPGRVLAA